jgi:hypothetical protein
LDVHAVALVLAGAIRLLLGDPVNRDQGAVEDRVRQSADPAHRGGQVIGGRQGEQGLAGGVETPPPRSAGITVAADEVGEMVQGSGEQRNRAG